MKRTLEIWIADASPLFRDGLKHALRRPRYSVQGIGPTLAEILDSSMTAPDVVILGSNREPDLAELIERIRAQNPPGGHTRFILLNGDHNGAVNDCKGPAPSALKCLVDAILPRTIPSKALPHFVEIIVLRQQIFNAPPERYTGAASAGNPDIFAPAPKSHVADPKTDLPASSGVASALYPDRRDPDRRITLSEREREILHHLRLGLSNKLIARRLNISDSTVKTHMKTLLQKMRVCNRTQAAIRASEPDFLM
jgi:DNA-binding NarL/FixJ family response regulator